MAERVGVVAQVSGGITQAIVGIPYFHGVPTGLVGGQRLLIGRQRGPIIPSGIGRVRCGHHSARIITKNANRGWLHGTALFSQRIVLQI